MLHSFDKAIHVFKPLLWDSAVRLALKRVFAAVPLLGLGPVGMVVTWIVTRLADTLFVVLEKEMGIDLVPRKNQKLLRRYENASIGLGEIAKKYGPESKKFLEARESEKKAFSDLVRFGIN